MKLYADSTARRTRQILSDALVLCWVATWVWVGRTLHDAIQTLREPADTITSAGRDVEDALNGAGAQAAQLPLVGDGLRDWLGQAASSGVTLQEAGTSMADTVETVATAVGVSVALTPILVVGGLWLWLRVRFVRRATSAQRYIDEAADLDLFALRALARQPMPALARVSPDPAGAWRREDPEVIRALAALELRDQGLRLPAHLR